MTIQRKATEQYLLGAVYYALQGDSKLLSLWMKSKNVTIEMKATEQYFPVLMFFMLCKVVLTFESVDEILKCDHSNESYCELLFTCFS